MPELTDWSYNVILELKRRPDWAKAMCKDNAFYKNFKPGGNGELK
jgi:hypothetical protein